MAQLPSNTAGARRLKKIEEHIPTSVFDTEADQEMQAEYGVQGTEFKPAFLYVERGPGAGQLLEVKQGTVVVGRASVSDLRLQHPSISRRHTQIKRVGEQFFVKDLGSQNGTFVNKSRIATEVEVKPGDSIALGNALLRLRGPLAKGEKLPGQSTQAPKHVPAPSPSVESPTPPPTSRADVTSTKSRISTAVVARPSGPQPGPTTTALKIAVFAGAVGFSLAAVLAFALVKTMSSDKPSPTTVAKKGSSADSEDKSERAKLIDEAIKRKMAEKPAAKAAPAPKEEPAAEEEPVIESDDAVGVKEQPKAPVVAKAPVVTPVAPKASPAPVRKAAAASKDDEDDEDAAPAKGAGGGKRATILAPYEKGNAESSLDLAKKAGDKELTDKLSRFIAAYDAANDAMMSNNGTAAIANFQKALALDEQLSSGWGKYGAEIRRQLANLYVLVGLAFVNNGDTEKAKTAFQGALKHDPNNARAKTQLAKLTGGEAKPKSADDAFDEEPAPKKAPAKKAPPKSSIDDAFGD
ncbi:MAG: FHA domain-containing protein [Archangium sp.]